MCAPCFILYDTIQCVFMIGSDAWDECFPGAMACMFPAVAMIFFPIIMATKALLVIQSCETQLQKDQGQLGVVGGAKPPKRYLATQPNSEFSPAEMC